MSPELPALAVAYSLLMAVTSIEGIELVAFQLDGVPQTFRWPTVPCRTIRSERRPNRNLVSYRLPVRRNPGGCGTISSLVLSISHPKEDDIETTPSTRRTRSSSNVVSPFVSS